MHNTVPYTSRSGGIDTSICESSVCAISNSIMTLMVHQTNMPQRRHTRCLVYMPRSGGNNTQASVTGSISNCTLTANHLCDWLDTNREGECTFSV
jgi:hypothetical protein